MGIGNQSSRGRVRGRGNGCGSGRANGLGWAAVAAGLIALAVGVGQASAEARVALVIGNSEYATARLRNPRNDATMMARTLAKAGFQVMTVMDVNRADMRQAIADFGARLNEPDTVALFYYAGHGVQAGNENFLIPAGSDVRTMDDVVGAAVPLSTVLDTMAQAKAAVNIVLLDACRNNPFAATVEFAARDGLVQVVAPAGTIIGYATAPGEIAGDGDGENSPYTEALAANIPKAGATVEEVFRAARRRVRELTGNRQTPWEHSSLIGEFTFSPKSQAPESSAAALPSTPLTPPDARLAEIEAWEKIRDLKEPSAFEAHLKAYPAGLFAELAAVRLAKLERRRKVTPWSYIITGDLDRQATSAAAIAAYDKALALDGAAASETDKVAAAQLYAEAAAAGLPAAQFALARAHEHGRGVARNLDEAVRWYTLAADARHVGAMVSLGTLYEFGTGVPVNLVEAVRYYRLAADAGDGHGQTSLAYLFQQGKGVARDAGAARRLYEAAAKSGVTRAMFNLALMKLRGQGGAVDISGAVKLLQAAADKDHAGAMMEIAFLHDNGRGLKRDAKAAAEFVLKALTAAKRDGRTLTLADYSWSFATRRQLQLNLAAKGLYAGIAHGIFNQATRRALQAYAEKAS